MKFATKQLKSRSGESLIEYTLIATFAAIGSVILIAYIGGNLETQVTTMGSRQADPPSSVGSPSDSEYNR